MRGSISIAMQDPEGAKRRGGVVSVSVTFYFLNSQYDVGFDMQFSAYLASHFQGWFRPAR